MVTLVVGDDFKIEKTKKKNQSPISPTFERDVETVSVKKNVFFFKKGSEKSIGEI
jgi:hypothetical protein